MKIKYFKLLTILAILPIYLSSCGSDNNEIEVSITNTIFGIEEDDSGDAAYVMNSTKMGTSTFSEKNGVVTLTLNLEGFTAGTTHAVHIHNGSCEDPGMHWNQNVTTSFCDVTSLGEVWLKPKAGDVGNVVIGNDGTGTLTVKTDLWSITQAGDKNIMNKVLMVHENGEDFIMECNPDHNHNHNNPKVACTTIETQAQ